MIYKLKYFFHIWATYKHNMPNPLLIRLYSYSYKIKLFKIRTIPKKNVKIVRDAHYLSAGQALIISSRNNPHFNIEREMDTHRK